MGSYKDDRSDAYRYNLGKGSLKLKFCTEDSQFIINWAYIVSMASNSPNLYQRGVRNLDQMNNYQYAEMNNQGYLTNLHKEYTDMNLVTSHPSNFNTSKYQNGKRFDLDNSNSLVNTKSALKDKTGIYSTNDISQSHFSNNLINEYQYEGNQNVSANFSQNLSHNYMNYKENQYPNESYSNNISYSYAMNRQESDSHIYKRAFKSPNTKLDESSLQYSVTPMNNRPQQTMIGNFNSQQRVCDKSKNISDISEFKNDENYESMFDEQKQSPDQIME